MKRLLGMVGVGVTPQLSLMQVPRPCLIPPQP